jgi:hypothetical protein
MDQQVEIVSHPDPTWDIFVLDTFLRINDESPQPTARQTLHEMHIGQLLI